MGRDEKTIFCQRCGERPATGRVANPKYSRFFVCNECATIFESELRLTNYLDSKCAWGYITLCDDCRSKAPRHVDTNHPIKDYLPADHCEICKRPGSLH